MTAVTLPPRTDTSWVQTFSGKRIHPLNAHPDEICIEDIAHALSNQCRFTGHVKSFYSVSEHSVRCSWIVPEELRLAALLHDASEAYMGDMSRPMKHSSGLLGELYRQYEENLERIIAEKFGLPHPMPPEIKEADDILLMTERRDLLPHLEWDDACRERWKITKVEPLASTIRPWEPRLAEQMFLNEYEQLTHP